MLASFLQFNLSTDTVILLTITAILAAGIMLGQHKVKTFALSAYVGIALAGELGQPLFELLQSRGLTMGGAIGLTAVRIGLFVAPIIGLELGHNQSQKGRRRGLVLTMILSLLTAALVVASILGFIEPEPRQALLQSSTLASLLYSLRLWWLGVVPVVAIVESFAKTKDR